jgi:hypothetical protein
VKCQEFTTVVGAEPNARSDELESHAAECADCAAFRRELQELDRAVRLALHAEPRANDPAPASNQKAFSSMWSRAAAILIAIGLASAVWLAGARSTLADEVVAHVRGEPSSLLHSFDVVPAAEVSRVLSRAGLQLRPDALRISYAQGCWFRSHFAPHLVAQTDAGPVSVLILPEEPTPRTARHIRAAGFEGMVVPAPRGALVFLGRGVHVDRVAQSMLDALTYSS